MRVCTRQSRFVHAPFSRLHTASGTRQGQRRRANSSLGWRLVRRPAQLNFSLCEWRTPSGPIYCLFGLISDYCRMVNGRDRPSKLRSAWITLSARDEHGVRREEKSPGTTSEERLCAEAPVRCRYCASQPAISEVVTRDGPALYNRGDRSSMTAFGAVLWIKKLFPWPLWGFSHWE